jgi:hypothetical protein
MNDTEHSTASLAPARRFAFEAARHQLSPRQHFARIGMLLFAAALLVGWVIRHTEVVFADGLRYIHQAERLGQGQWFDGLVRGIDHPLHPLGIAAVHQMLGGNGPESWERAALALCAVSFVLLVIPVYLLTRELLGDQAAWLGTFLVIFNPLVSLIAVNVLSESTFLLFWTTGLWGAVAYLRRWHAGWLVLAIGAGGLAYLTRPEGLLLPLALAAAVVVATARGVTRVRASRSLRLVGLAAIGLALLVGPYIALKGSIGTKPAIARVIGLAPSSLPLALEREVPLDPDQTAMESYKLAIQRMLRAFRIGGSAPLFPFALVGIALAARTRDRAIVWLFLAIILAASAVVLVRLHLTGGYCGARHGVVPGMILTLAAAGAISWGSRTISIPGRLLGQPARRPRPGIAIWGAMIALLAAAPNTHLLAPATPDPFAIYRSAARWLADHTTGREQILDLTDWSLYFSERPGYRFASVYEAPGDPSTRWVVVRKPHLTGRWYYTQVVRQLVAGIEPVAVIPDHRGPNQIQILIFDRGAPASVREIAASPSVPTRSTR